MSVENENKKIELIPVKSSNISHVGYLVETSQLIIRFINDSVFIYSDVSEIVYSELLASESIGKYFNQKIKNNYKFEKVD